MLIVLTWMTLTWALPGLVVVCFWRYRGATPGQLIIGIKVVDQDSGEIPPIPRLIGRYCAYTLSAIPLGLGFLRAGFDPRKQAWHDLLARTVVVKSAHIRREEPLPNSAHLPRAAAWTGKGLGAAIVMYSIAMAICLISMALNTVFVPRFIEICKELGLSISTPTIWVCNYHFHVAAILGVTAFFAFVMSLCRSEGLYRMAMPVLMLLISTLWLAGAFVVVIRPLLYLTDTLGASL